MGNQLPNRCVTPCNPVCCAICINPRVDDSDAAGTGGHKSAHIFANSAAVLSEAAEEILLEDNLEQELANEVELWRMETSSAAMQRGLAGEGRSSNGLSSMRQIDGLAELPFERDRSNSPTLRSQICLQNRMASAELASASSASGGHPPQIGWDDEVLVARGLSGDSQAAWRWGSAGSACGGDRAGHYAVLGHTNLDDGIAFAPGPPAICRGPTVIPLAGTNEATLGPGIPLAVPVPAVQHAEDSSPTALPVDQADAAAGGEKHVPLERAASSCSSSESSFIGFVEDPLEKERQNEVHLWLGGPGVMHALAPHQGTSPARNYEDDMEAAASTMWGSNEAVGRAALASRTDGTCQVRADRASF